MSTKINDTSMSLEIDGRFIATAEFRDHAAADGHGAWIVSCHPARLLPRNQAITAMVLAERLAAGYGGYCGCRPSCTVGRPQIPAAGLMICSTSSRTRTSRRLPGTACAGTRSRQPVLQALERPDWAGELPPLLHVRPGHLQAHSRPYRAARRRSRPPRRWRPSGAPGWPPRRGLPGGPGRPRNRCHRAGGSCPARRRGGAAHPRRPRRPRRDRAARRQPARPAGRADSASAHGPVVVPQAVGPGQLDLEPGDLLVEAGEDDLRGGAFRPGRGPISYRAHAAPLPHSARSSVRRTEPTSVALGSKAIAVSMGIARLGAAPVTKLNW